MRADRKTAIVQIELFSGAAEGGLLPLATERDFAVSLTVEGVSYPAQNFRSPINDTQWRDFLRRLSDCNVQHSDTNYRVAAAIRSLVQQLYQSLVALNPVLREFLGRAGVPRRLVIQTSRPELHLLPWGALIDDSGTFLAAGDLSVVQSWGMFNLMPATTDNKLQLMTVLGQDTNQATAGSLDGHPPEIQLADGSQAFFAGKRVDGVDILHLEEHGSAVTNSIGDVFAQTLANTFADVKVALLWSCLSGAANSWGESPALCLHRNGVGMVLSFLAELHNLDAKSISSAFYLDVFGPAASRDPESALVRIRSAKFKEEFPYANWASMTLYMSCPLDLSALPLNGPRVPASAWNSDPLPDPGIVPGVAVDVPVTEIREEAAADSATATEDDTVDLDLTVTSASDASALTPATVAPALSHVADLWADLAKTVSQLQPGTVNEFDGFDDPTAPVLTTLPIVLFRPWRGNVIHLDGGFRPLTDEIISELNLDKKTCPSSEAAEKLVWFFNRIARYGSPLIVWTNASHRHMAFLKTIEPSSTLTFLLIYGQQPEPTILELVDSNLLEEAQAAAAALPPDSDDEQLSAAYFACARMENSDQAIAYMRRIKNPGELMLLIGNFISRRGNIPNPRPDWMLNHPDGRLTTLQQQHCQEDCYRKVMSDPGSEAPLRESGRAKHELGYLLQSLGKKAVAEMLYGQALADLEGCTPEQHDSRWHTALGNLLRDWADLLSDRPDQLNRASELLRRAMAIHSFHGRKLQMAYALDTAARIDLAAGRYSEAIEHSVETANMFEEFKNWRGWGEAIKVLFDCLSETRETTRMMSLADLAVEKLHHSNLPQSQRDRLRLLFIFEKAKACWIAGNLSDARTELVKLGCGDAPMDCKVELDPGFEREVRRLWKFLDIAAKH